MTFIRMTPPQILPYTSYRSQHVRRWNPARQGMDRHPCSLAEGYQKVKIEVPLRVG
jgi:hypothetical protein